MTQTMSAPNDWLQFYNQNLTPSIPGFTSNTIATPTTSVITETSPPPDMSNSSPSGSTHLSPEGRVTKPTRRRSRASRRTPTTLLNTDTTNFRAMVQQFTGGPSAPFAPTPSSTPQVLPNLIGFGFPSRPGPSLSPTTLVMASPPISFHHLQQQQHMFQPQNQQYNLYSDGGDNMFFQRLSNNPTSNVVRNNNRDEGLLGHGSTIYQRPKCTLCTSSILNVISFVKPDGLWVSFMFRPFFEPNYPRHGITPYKLPPPTTTTYVSTAKLTIQFFYSGGKDNNMFSQRLSNNPTNNVVVSNNNRDEGVNMDDHEAFFPRTSSS
ncbi:VQ motif-containing protein 22, partial [Mucuna pruriens]